MSRSVGGSRLLFLAQFAANVGPELFNHVGDGVISHLRAPNTGGVGQSAISAGVVAVGGNGSCGRAAENLREIKLLMPRIGARNEDAADRVARAMHKSPIALLKETGILVEHGREDCSSQKVLDGAVGKGCPETLAVALRSLSIPWFAVFCLADT